MAVVTRKRSVRVVLVVAAGFPLLLAGGAALLTVVIGQSCGGSGVGDAPSRVAVRDIPARMLAIYQQVGAQYKLPWEVHIPSVLRDMNGSTRNSGGSLKPGPLSATTIAGPSAKSRLVPM